jgi:hypothetical protein
VCRAVQLPLPDSRLILSGAILSPEVWSLQATPIINGDAVRSGLHQQFPGMLETMMRSAACLAWNHAGQDMRAKNRQPGDEH